MNTRSGQQLQDNIMHMTYVYQNSISQSLSELTYNKILQLKVFLSPVGIQNRDLVLKVPVGTLQNKEELITFNFMYHIIHVYNI